MPRMHIAFDADWQPRKCEVVTNELRRFLTQARAGNIGIVEPVDATVPAKKYLVLECRNNNFGKKCGTRWETQFFTPCPTCGQRRYVHKVEARTEEPLPPIGDPPNSPIDPVPAEDQPEETAPPAA